MSTVAAGVPATPGRDRSASTTTGATTTAPTTSPATAGDVVPASGPASGFPVDSGIAGEAGTDRPIRARSRCQSFCSTESIQSSIVAVSTLLTSRSTIRHRTPIW